MVQCSVSQIFPLSFPCDASSDPVMLPAFPFNCLLSLCSHTPMFPTPRSTIPFLLCFVFLLLLVLACAPLYPVIAHPLAVPLLRTSLVFLGLPVPHLSPFPPGFPAAVLPVDTAFFPPTSPVFFLTLLYSPALSD